MTTTNPGKLNARKPAIRTATVVTVAVVPTWNHASECARKLRYAAALVAPQGRTVNVLLRALVARRALVVTL